MCAGYKILEMHKIVEFFFKKKEENSTFKVGEKFLNKKKVN